MRNRCHCYTWGDSYEHLLEMLKDAIQGWLEVASERKEFEPEKQLVEIFT
jgi:predicted RNase H-like HicB family nuclease